MLLISIFIICIIAKMFYLQVLSYENLFTKATNTWQRKYPISGYRGRIIDRNGNVLANDITCYSLILVPNQIKDKERVAQEIGAVLNIESSKILEQISKSTMMELIKEGRKLSDENMKKISALNLEGVYLVKDSKRYYPYHNFLAQTLGFTGIDNQGLSGLENSLDEYLKASKGALMQLTDAKGHSLNVDNYLYPGIGNDVILTIDYKIQSIVERELNKAMLMFQPDTALAIATDPNTNEILAICSKPDFDPNNYQEYPASTYDHNLPIWMTFEPGSTMKVLTFAAALEENVIDMEKDTFFDPGYVIVEGQKIKSWKKGGHGLQTYLEVLQNSSNPGFVNIGQKLGKDKLYEYATKFGLLNKTGVDITGESKGIFFNKDNFGPVEQATTAFGQGPSLTPIQLITAFNSTINGGKLLKPYITKAIINNQTQDIIFENKPELIRTTISENTSFKMRYALENVVAKGGGRQAYIDGYKIGGKTGTAQKSSNGAYLANEYILSFVSCAPANDPKISLYIALDAPKNIIQYGGVVVGPIVKAMYEDILPYLQIEKVSGQIPKVTTWLDPVMIEVPNLIGEDINKIKSKDYQIVSYGKGDKVIEQLPTPKEKIEKGKTIWVMLG